jgi:hypothetical protein
MPTQSDPHNVRQFVENLAAGTRVIWIANGTKGTVQPDKTILWDNGSSMTSSQMSHSHALLIHSESEWQQMQSSLNSLMKCLRCGCTLQRWDARGRKNDRPEELCPIAVLSDPDSSPLGTKPHLISGSVRLGAPRMRHRLRA